MLRSARLLLPRARYPALQSVGSDRFKNTKAHRTTMQLALFLIFGALAVAGAVNLLLQRYPSTAPSPRRRHEG